MNKYQLPINKYQLSMLVFFVFFIVHFFLLTGICFAEQEFGLRAAPFYGIPLGEENVQAGFGGAVSFDWGFLQFPKKTGLGLSLAGAGGGFGVPGGSAMSFFEAGMGPFFTWRIIDRVSVRAGADAGVYQYSYNGGGAARPRFGGAVSGAFHITPSLAVFAEGGYNWYSFSQKPINAIRASVGISLNLGELLFSPARLHGEKTEQRRVFPVSYSWYEKNEVAMVKITNNEPNAIRDIQLSFFLERYMNEPAQFANLENLAAGASAEFPVTALFNESMLELLENVEANARVLAEYRSLGIRRRAEFPAPMTVFHRNAMSWDDDRRAASFVSARDPAAVYFAKYVESAVRNTPANAPRSVLLAAAMFEALRAYGINYVVDPASSYIELSENASALDDLNYPYQTLLYRGGDCDDLSILFCSLLEVVGVETAFITIPGHIYAAVEAGGASWLAGSASVIELEGKRWLPVEITVPSEGFNRAWNIGARQWRSAGTEARLYPTRESWLLYQPVSVPGAGEALPVMPAENEITSAVMKELSKF
jgi:hypothetical protein